MGKISVNFGANDAYTIELVWTQGTQSIQNNTTALHFVCTLYSNRSSATFTGGGRTDTLTVGGNTVNPQHGSYVVPGGGSVKLWESDITVAHDSDGTYQDKQISVGVLIDNTFSSSGYIGTVTATGTVSLTAILRASTLLCGSLTLGQANSVTIQAASPGFRHDIYLTLGDSDVCMVHDWQGSGTVNFTPLMESLAAQIPNAKSGAGTLTLYTFNAEWTAEIGRNSYSVTINVPSSAAPQIATGWALANYYNTGTAAADIEAFVQGYSKAQVTFDTGKITLQYGATVERFEISCNGVTNREAPYLTGVLTDTTGKIVCTVTDSRGYSASSTLDVSILPYKKPTLSNLSLYRADADGTADDAGLCIFAKATLTFSDLDGKNTCSLQGFYRLQAGSYPASGTEMQSDTGLFLTEAAANTATYVAKIAATDSLGNSAAYEATIPTDSVAFHIRDGGRGAAFGKYAEEDNLLDIAWNLCVRGELDSGTKSRLFDTSYSLTARTYPTAAGIYWVPGVNVFSNMTPDSPYGILIIFHSVYSLHLYLDAYGFLYYGYSSEDFQEPAKWWYVSRNEQT